MSTNSKPVEGNPDFFSLDEMIRFQKETWKLLENCVKEIKPGMQEGAAVKLIEAALKQNNIKINWHKTHVRFGSNTLMTYSEVSDSATVLKENDIFFVDMGPVWNRQYESDCGRTYTVGNSTELQECAAASEKIFEITRDAWKKENLTGEKLYQVAVNAADRLGYDLVKEVDGHRIGGFPHSSFYSQGLPSFDRVPAPGVWVLEIQIRHRTKQFGAFFEDLLY